MDKRIIFLDIDGTLTEPGKNEPPSSALWAVGQARKQGHAVYLCTGRNYGMLSPLLRYGFDGFIASSGGYIECGGRTIYDCPMTEGQSRFAMDILKKNGVYRTAECMYKSYTDEGFKEFLRKHADEGNNSEMLRWREQIESSLDIRPMREYSGQPVYKIGFMSLSLEQLAEPEEFLSADFGFCIQDADVDGFINGEVVNRKFDKGRAVRKVCDHLGMPVSASIAVGDSMNDKEMLETAGLSICMANGSDRLKPLADDICPPVSEDGIREAFIKYRLLMR